jgi:acyl-CoA hydrolase
LRHAINDGTTDFNSIFLQEIPLLFRRGAINLNAVLLHVSPPDENGYCSLGTSVDGCRAAVTTGLYILIQMNYSLFDLLL